MSLFAGQKTAQGFTRVSLAQILSSLNALWQSAYGSFVDLDPRSADGQMIGGIAEMMDDLNSAVADLMNIANPNGATGAFLSNISDIDQRQAQPATAKCHYIGTPGTAVPYTFTVQSTADGSSWQPLQAPAPQVTIGVDGTAAERSPAQSRAVLPRHWPGTLTDITTLMAGIDSVTNDLGTIDGDPNLRDSARNWQRPLPRNQWATCCWRPCWQSLTSPTLVVRVNASSEPALIGGVTINANTVRVVVETDGDASVDPTVTTSSTDPIANTIFALKSMGCGTQGGRARGHSMLLGFRTTSTMTWRGRWTCKSR